MRAATITNGVDRLYWLGSGYARFFLLSAVWLAFGTSTAMAQAKDYDMFSLSVGVFITDRNSDTRIDASSGTRGTDVDLENELGLGNSDSVFRIDGYYRFAEKHRFDFSAFDLSRRATAALRRDIVWNGTLFPISADVDSDFDLKIYKAAYNYAFMQGDKGYLGATAGLYIADFTSSISAPALGEREVGDATAPLPVFGLRGDYRFSERWSFRASGEVFLFEYDDYDGSLYDIYAGLDYQLFGHVALGVGVNSVRLDIGVTKQNLTGDLDWRYDGALLFLKFDF